MTLVIVSILIIGYVLISTGWMTNVNRAAVAVFMGTVGWVLYICYGTDFVLAQHPREYSDFLMGVAPNPENVKHFISQNIFLDYVGRGAEIALFLLATMSIVEILNNNGCFDFLTELLYTRSSKKMLWLISIVTFVISANLDNLTTTTMMLVIIHKILANRRQRMLYGSAVIIAANCGGALTVIGDPTGLVLWNIGAVDASDFSMYLALPCLVSMALPVWWLGRQLPERVETQGFAIPYRGDDTNLNRWQRMLMLFLGIGGLWFIPTFHNITKLSPFLGALCVLSLLWVVNEIFNRRLMDVDKMIQRRIPRVLQYGVIQMVLFVLGIMFAVGVVVETGAVSTLAQWIDDNVHNVWILGIVSGFFGSVLDTFATSMSFVSLHPVVDVANLGLWADSDYVGDFVRNGVYWKIIAYCSAMGGNMLLIGSVSGLALMKMERIRLGWYLRNVGWICFVAWLIGLAIMWGTTFIY
ncbi:MULTISPECIES: SLC13 family permease [Prevotella]|jgi:Na+/H+ antiporter NhaD/arsenite permease-like protein|uniref:NhaD sodium:hydrogen antiporter family sodium transporter n=2 Tax=Prevotella pectinovora TaxID=1602169 RepID=A0A0D0I7Y7_9BACT|nr:MULTISPECIES: SLC13 family permease [Prevotella]KIP57627.1 NhaD sodium:hydrogen antiporter family sodium transporter [Prevotella pectinovora]KIP64604.1 NhaD sodium:hydrogen antiporter family sodium transporter [Prevotella pectinovora]MCI6048761.1 sodium:proton antiporter [Prevotella pectinovora]MDD7744021.1 SLC13 family permease [Prevotella pectinovora]MDY4778698.1 SLC13 family permease [Prevotella pectinovora]